jgi:hypothetical protein
MDPNSDWLIETTDYEGTAVCLSRATWQTKIVEHPEINDYLDDVRLTIESPDLVYQSTRDERSRIFYRLYVGRQQWQDKHLVVVVKYVQESGGRRGYISTIYLSRAIYSRGEQIWKNLEKNFPSE